ncbi:hypothetical protein MKW98_009660 [Papaver atlanticum]|uniref:Uncharacterized protein n=1 Tax=Papaver atlanticum TaxID=357466 RepID=A0AAD4SCD9_9MAGN|nr:hypothetical protein MKW98_009660 [Papaver atlanticum]
MDLRTFLKPYMAVHKFKIHNIRVVLSLEHRVISEDLRRLTICSSAGQPTFPVRSLSDSSEKLWWQFIQPMMQDSSVHQALRNSSFQSPRPLRAKMVSSSDTCCSDTSTPRWSWIFSATCRDTMICVYYILGVETRSLGYKILDEWRPWFFNNRVAGYLQGYENNLMFLHIKTAKYKKGSWILNQFVDEQHKMMLVLPVMRSSLLSSGFGFDELGLLKQIQNSVDDVGYVLRDSSWLFKGYIMQIRRYDCSAAAADVCMRYEYMWANLNKLQPHHHFKGVPRSIVQRIREEVKLMDPEDGFPADRRRAIIALVKMDMTKIIPRKVKPIIKGVETKIDLWFDKVPIILCSLCRIIDHPHTRCGNAQPIPQALPLFNQAPSFTMSVPEIHQEEHVTAQTQEMMQYPVQLLLEHLVFIHTVRQRQLIPSSPLEIAHVQKRQRFDYTSLRQFVWGSGSGSIDGLQPTPQIVTPSFPNLIRNNTQNHYQTVEPANSLTELTQLPESLPYSPGFAEPGTILSTLFGPGYFDPNPPQSIIQPSDLEMNLAPMHLSSALTGCSSVDKTNNAPYSFVVNPFSQNQVNPHPILFGTPVAKTNSSGFLFANHMDANMNKIMGLAASLTSPEAIADQQKILRHFFGDVSPSIVTGKGKKAAAPRNTRGRGKAQATS